MIRRFGSQMWSGNHCWSRNWDEDRFKSAWIFRLKSINFNSWVSILGIKMEERHNDKEDMEQLLKDIFGKKVKIVSEIKTEDENGGPATVAFDKKIVEKIEKRYKRQVIADTDGVAKIHHHGDCDFFNHRICTCGLLHDLRILYDPNFVYADFDKEEAEQYKAMTNLSTHIDFEGKRT